MPKLSTQTKTKSSAKTKSKPRIRIAVKSKPKPQVNPKKRKRAAKSSALSTKTSTTKSPNGQAFDIEKTLTSLALFAEKQPRSDADLAKVAIGCSANHHNLKSDVLNDCVNCLKTYGSKWETLLVPTKVKMPHGEAATVPLFVKVLAGEKSQAKLELTNKILIDWQVVTKKKGVSSKCPWYQPSTQAMRLRTFFGSMNKSFLWKMKLEEDFTGEKMVSAVLAALFAKRLKKYKETGYGEPNSNRRLLHGDREKVKLSSFNEDDPRQHQMKILFGCGAKFGFRGSQEHVFLELRHVRKGTFEEGHPMEGMTYYGFGGFEDKTHKLSMSNVYLPNDDDLMRCPLVKSDPENLAASIESYLEKCTPGQTRFYCKAMCEKSKEKYVRNGGDKKHTFMPNIPLGKTKIKELFDDGAKILGLSKADDFFPHSLRAMFITDLANDPSVSTREAQISARHSSVHSTANYMTRDGLSETNKYMALGMMNQETLDANAAAPSNTKEDTTGGEIFDFFFILYSELRNLHYCVSVKKYFLNLFVLSYVQVLNSRTNCHLLSSPVKNIPISRTKTTT